MAWTVKNTTTVYEREIGNRLRREARMLNVRVTIKRSLGLNNTASTIRRGWLNLKKIKTDYKGGFFKTC